MGTTKPAPAADSPDSPERRDRELVEGVLRKDRKATTDFVALHADAIYSYIQHRLPPHGDQADDVVQEVFLAAWEQLPGFRGESSLRTWLLGIARHKVQDYYRERLRNPESLPEDDDSSSEGLLRHPDLDELLDRESMRGKTREVLDSLPEMYSIALLWRYWEKRSTREIAAQTEKTEKAVERLLARAREQFMKRWIRV